jgi:DNA-binding transcriptional MerR regulator
MLAASIDSSTSHCHDIAVPNEQEYTISELADLAAVTPRTIRYYVSIGLLSSPGQSGPKTRYGDGHLQRLRLIKRLQREHLPLGEIGARLEGLDDEAVDEALAVDGLNDAPGSALDYIKRLQQGEEDMVSASPRFDAVDPSFAEAPIEMKPPTLKPEPPSTKRSQWDRVELGQNVELHIRRPLSRQEHKNIERLIRIGREILEEDQS